jgi:hypothetical protein
VHDPRALTMMSCSLGQFGLRFELGGRLRQLRLPDGTRILHECDYVLDTGQGRSFNPSGWDECFPTIEPTGESPAMGDLVWQGPQVYRASRQVEQVWQMPTYMAQRVFQLPDDNELEMIFRIRAGDTRLRFLWASHALFSTAGLRSVQLPDGLRLDEFRPNNTCRKFFVAAGAPVVLSTGGPRVELRTDQPYWGIWYNRGGWPIGSPAGFSCIGIEATNTAADSPADREIPPGGSFEGRMIVRVM